MNKLYPRFFSSLARKFQVSNKVKETPLIVCKNTKLNLYKDQIPKNAVKFGEIPLASNGWHHRKSKGDFFVLNPIATDPFENSLPVLNFAKDLNKNLMNNLRNELEIEELTKFQAEAFNSIKTESHILMAAETGCGKTLAYLLPLIQNVIQAKIKSNRQMNTPLMLVLTPGRELALQVSKVAHDLSKNLELNIKTVVGGNTKQLIMNPDFQDVDILVGTIGAISKLTTTGIYKMNQVRYLVLDEADTLLDDSFSEKLNHFLKKFPFYKISVDADSNDKDVATQLVLVSATMPNDFSKCLSNVIDIDTVKEVVSENLHKLLPHVQQKFCRMNKSDRPANLITLVKSELNKNRPLIIFGNKSKTSDFVSIFLNEAGINCINLNGDMLMKIRLGRFEQFQKGNVNVLATTDVASRGLDTCRARHVINFDFPLYVSDYIHRCGRVGRFGSVENCFVTNFVSSRREISNVQRIEHAARTGAMLPDVNANVTGIIRDQIVKELNEAE